MTSGGTYAGEFYAGWLVEYSLSIDNLFIFIIIMSKFAVPRELQQYTLMIGIVMALVMRAIFIAVGAAAIEQFSWVFYLFGAFLIYTAYKLAKEGAEDEDDYEENRLVLFVEKRFPATKEWHGKALFIKQNGARLITPLFIVIITLGTTDLLFALDSIPAIFGITKEPYLVLTANIFALMGLRQLLLPDRRAPRAAGLPVVRPRVPARVHRRQADLPRAARERAAVHQRWRAPRLRLARDPDLALLDGDRRDAGGHGSALADEVRRDEPAAAGRRHRSAA